MQTQRQINFGPAQSGRSPIGARGTMCRIHQSRSLEVPMLSEPMRIAKPETVIPPPPVVCVESVKAGARQLANGAVVPALGFSSTLQAGRNGTTSAFDCGRRGEIRVASPTRKGGAVDPRAGRRLPRPAGIAGPAGNSRRNWPGVHGRPPPLTGEL